MQMEREKLVANLECGIKNAKSVIANQNQEIDHLSFDIQERDRLL